MRARRARTAAGAALIVLITVAAGLLGFGETYAARTPVATRTPAGHAPTGPLAAATRTPAPPATSTAPAAAPAAVRTALAGALRAGGLGPETRGEVVDAATGAVLLDHGGAVPAAPASTSKLLAAAAILRVHAPTATIATRVDTGAGGSIVLVGGGDPTLSGARAGVAPAYAGAARLSDLAAAVTRAHLTPTRIIVDDSAFAGAGISPYWAAEDVPSDYGAAITAVMTDGGRAAPGATNRSTTPDLDAGHELAALLGHPGLPVSRAAAPAAARVLGTVHSAPYATLVAQMLMESDNVIAECLGRLVARAVGQAPTFAGAAAGIRIAVRRLGIDPGAGMVDASGLAARDRLSPATLARLLAAIARDRTGDLGDVVAGLPVAGWSGSLQDRYLAGTPGAAAGLVRAKTGTLTGVSALAGLVHDAAGRLLAFSFIADRTASTPAAEAALDVLAADLARCICG